MRSIGSAMASSERSPPPHRSARRGLPELGEFRGSPRLPLTGVSVLGLEFAVGVRSAFYLEGSQPPPPAPQPIDSPVR